MGFQTVYVYDGSGNFIGYSIHKDGAKKLHTANLWTDQEADDLKEQLLRLNEDVLIRSAWPDARDPEVQALLNDPDWEPLKLTAIEVVDEENSVFVWVREPSDEDPHGQLDEQASNIVYKTEYAPSPVDVQARARKACEAVARKRTNSEH